MLSFSERDFSFFFFFFFFFSWTIGVLMNEFR